MRTEFKPCSLFAGEERGRDEGGAALVACFGATGRDVCSESLIAPLRRFDFVVELACHAANAFPSPQPSPRGERERHGSVMVFILSSTQPFPRWGPRWWLPRSMSPGRASRRGGGKVTVASWPSSLPPRPSGERVGERGAARRFRNYGNNDPELPVWADYFVISETPPPPPIASPLGPPARGSPAGGDRQHGLVAGRLHHFPLSPALSPRGEGEPRWRLPPSISAGQTAHCGRGRATLVPSAIDVAGRDLSSWARSAPVASWPSTLPPRPSGESTLKGLKAGEGAPGPRVLTLPLHHPIREPKARRPVGDRQHGLVAERLHHFPLSPALSPAGRGGATLAPSAIDVAGPGLSLWERESHVGAFCRRCRRASPHTVEEEEPRHHGLPHFPLAPPGRGLGRGGARPARFDPTASQPYPPAPGSPAGA